MKNERCAGTVLNLNTSSIAEDIWKLTSDVCQGFFFVTMYYIQLANLSSRFPQC